MDVVLDASVALSWCLPAQATAATEMLLREADAITFWAPSIFQAEVINVLLRAEYSGKLTPDASRHALKRLEDLGIEHLVEPDQETVGDLTELARTERLSFFDACYLQLGMLLNIPLASRDGALLTAASRRGLPAMDLS